MTDRSMVNREQMRSGHRPYLTTYGTPAYCAMQRWIVVRDADGVEHIYYVERVDRAWLHLSGEHAERLADGSRRKFEPEDSQTNGRNPCLLYILGQPQPWYYDSGWDTVRAVSFGQPRGADYDP